MPLNNFMVFFLFFVLFLCFCVLCVSSLLLPPWRNKKSYIIMVCIIKIDATDSMGVLCSKCNNDHLDYSDSERRGAASLKERSQVK